MTAIPHPNTLLRAAGWSRKGRLGLVHTSGAAVTPSLGLWSAKRADGQALHGIVNRETAIAWALGKDVTPWTSGERAVQARAAPKAEPGPWAPAGRGVLRHARGTVAAGYAGHGHRATLTNGERRDFKVKADAQAWVEGGGVFKPGYVPAERRGQ